MNKKSYIIVTITIVLSVLFLIVLNRADHSEHVYTKKKLTIEEKKWLHDLRRPLRVGVTHIPNQVIIGSDKNPRGLSIDILRQIEKEIGVKFKYVVFKTWGKLMSAAREGRVDIVFFAQKTKDRLSYLNFTDALLSQQNKIIVKVGSSDLSSVENLFHKRVALVKNSALFSYVSQTYPQIKVIPATSELDALRKVSSGEVDATIAEPVRAGVYMKDNNIRNLVISGDLNYNYDLSIASRKDFPELNVILSKAVRNLSPETKKSLYLKWGYVKDKERLLDNKTLMFLLVAFGIILPFSIYLFLINKSLNREIEKRVTIEKELIFLNANLESRVREEVQKRREQELYLIEQNKLAQVGNMMNMIAHQWKQPLNNLSLLTQEVVYRYRKSKLDDDNIDSFDKKTKIQIKEMISVMNDFMNFFRPKDNNKRELSDIVSKSISIIEPAFLSQGIRIVYQNDLSEKDRKYSEALGQVIINIMNNAKDALLEHDVKDKEICIRVFRDTEDIVAIEDNAGGIPESIIENIFEPYFTTKANNNGTGLGLYICKMIMMNHVGGRLQVENTSKGALFTIRLNPS